MLRYCAWCGKYQGYVVGAGHQIRKNLSEIDTATICVTCMAKVMGEMPRSWRHKS